MKICRLAELQMSSKGSADKDYFHTSPQYFFTNAFFGFTTIGIEAKKKKDSFFSEGSMRSAIIESGSNNFNKNPTQ